MSLENQKILLKNTMPTGGTYNDEFLIFRIIELEVIQVIILVFLFYLEVISYH